MDKDLTHIDLTKEKYQKRFPSNYETEASKHFLNDKKVDVQLYSLLQSLSYAVDIKDEEGNVIGHETRVNVADIPSQRKLSKILGEYKQQKDGTTKFVSRSRAVIRKNLNYLLSMTEENIYCPYITLSEDGSYYTILNKEARYANISQAMVQYLVKGFSTYAIRTYIFLLAVYNYKSYQKEQKLKELTGKEKEELEKEPVEVIFCYSELARQIGYTIDKDNIKNYGDVWRADEERARTDPDYELGTIPIALIALRNGKLIEWKPTRNELGHKMYKLTKINTDIKAVLPDDKIEPMTEKDKETRKISKQIIEEQSILFNTPPKGVDPNYKKSKMSDECKKHLEQTFHF